MDKPTSQIKSYNLVFVLICILLVVAITLTISCSGTKPVIKSSWFFNKGNFDKNSIEIQKTRLYLDGKSKILYNIYNDRKNMYLCIKTGENKVQMKILRAGMTITIDTSGKSETKTKIVSLSYPIIDEVENELQPEVRSQNRQNWKTRKSEFLLSHTDMKLYGFKPPMKDIYPINNKFGLTVTVDWDSINNMYYLVKIPFKTFFKDSLSIADTSRIFTVAIISNGIPKPDFTRRQNTEENEISGGMEGGGRGGMGGGERRSYGGARNGAGYHRENEGEDSETRGELFQTHKILFNIKLSAGYQPF